MCGKCEPFMAKAAHGALVLGTLLLVLAAVSRLAHWGLCTLGPRSFTAGSALLLLLSIAIHSCPGVCRAEGEGHSH